MFVGSQRQYADALQMLSLRETATRHVRDENGKATELDADSRLLDAAILADVADSQVGLVTFAGGFAIGVFAAMRNPEWAAAYFAESEAPIPELVTDHYVKLI